MESDLSSSDQDFEAGSDGNFLPSTGEAVDLSEDVYLRIVQQVREICEAVSAKNDGDTALSSPSPSNEELDSIIRELSLSSAFPESAHFSGGLEESSTHLYEIESADVSPPHVVPAMPQTLQESGLPLNVVLGLVYKFMYLSGGVTLASLRHQVKLGEEILAEALQAMLIEGHVELQPDCVGGDADALLYQLTSTGRGAAREAFAVSRYLGPAPVTLAQFSEQMRHQSVAQAKVTPAAVNKGFADLVLSDDLIRRLGTAVSLGKSVLLTGESGQGKTVVANGLGRIVQALNSLIYIPYAIWIDGKILSYFDPTLHKSNLNVVSSESEEASVDLRWRLIQRPFVSVASESMSSAFTPRYVEEAGYYLASPVMKANGGAVLFDALDRAGQELPRVAGTLLGMLERSTQAVTWSDGSASQFPFQTFTVLAASRAIMLDSPEQFLRRIRCKIELTAPSEVAYREIFRRECERYGVSYDDWMITRLLTTAYSADLPPKASDPSDFLDIMAAICRLKGDRTHLSESLVLAAFRECRGIEAAA